MKNYLLCMIFMLISMSMGFTSCSSKDDEPGFTNLPTPPYESVSGKYVVNSASSDYESIELTASGNYIITLKSPEYRNTLAARSATSKNRVFTQAKPETRSGQSDLYVYGIYTQAGENTFELEGFGKITLEYAGGQVVAIEINISNSKVTVQVTKAPTMSDNEITNALCRTWELEKNVYEETDKSTGQTESGTLTPENPGMDESDFPKTVIFTKSGTYCISYLDGSVGVARWRWKDAKAGILEYIWEGEYGDSGECKLTFLDNTLEIYEEFDDEYDLCKYWYYLRAADAEPEKPDTEKPDTEKPGNDSPLKKVFTGKLLKEIDGDKMIYENGFLKEIKGKDFNMTFTYNYISQTPGPDVYAVLKSSNYTIEYEITLNNQGFAADVNEIYTDRYDTTRYHKKMTYDADGHLIGLNDTRNRRNHTIQWQNDCLFLTKWGNGNWTEMSLTNQPNTNCIMLYYLVNGIDIDDAQYLYWAGLLGKSSKTLPDAKVTESSDGDHEVGRFIWTDHSLICEYDYGSRETVNFSFYE